MNYNYKEKAMVVEDYIASKKYLCNPLSRNAIEQIESMGGTITSNHDTAGHPTFRYRVSFPDAYYSASIIKGYGTYGREADQWEVGVIYNETGDLSYDTDITNDVIGFLEEEDVLAILRLIHRLDENGNIKPLLSSQNEQPV